MREQGENLSRAQRMLAALASAPEGLTLAELGGLLGEEGRQASRSREVLKSLRKRGLVSFTLGRYRITEEGFMAVRPRAREAVSQVLATGAMEGEFRRVVRSVATAGQVRLQGVNWVFGQGLAQ